MLDLLFAPPSKVLTHSYLKKIWGKEFPHVIKEIYGVSPSTLIHSRSLSKKRLSLSQWATLIKSCIRYRIGYPYEYVWGHTKFCSRDYIVNRSVLIPRPETEEWIGRVIKDIRTGNFSDKIKILDIGTGSGVIAITMRAEFSSVEVSAVDVSLPALNIAQKNAHRLLGEEMDIRFLHGDIFNIPLDKLIPSGPFDIVVINPPYVGRSEKILSDQVVKYEPSTALFAGDDGIEFYQKLEPLLPTILSERGCFYSELGWQQAEKVFHLFRYFPYRKIVKDMYGKDRLFIGKM